MGVPTTTGVLRDKIQDMEIGDYIVCKYVASSGSVGVFSELGTSTATEIPVVGSARPNGTFYLVKVDKGLLIADRIVQHSINWDKLNTGKLIEGVSWGDKSAVPIMTSDNSPSGVASASSISSGYEAYKAFNGVSNDISTAWQTASGDKAPWIQYRFNESKKIQSYAISHFSSSVGLERAPKDWTLKGSNDGVLWVDLDSVFDQSNWSNEKRYYNFKNNESYLFYRLDISKNNGTSWTSIGEFELMEQPSFFIRSITGGVAYADANGNLSTTDQGFGAFPTNNEWDKYIVNFPNNNLQSGKTLDDVFHWNDTFTLTQDTFNTNSSFRIVRGRSVAKGFSWTSTSTIVAYVGFRPVFSYNELL